MTKKISDNQGFSLIEVIVYMAMLTVVFLSVLSIFIWTNTSKDKGRAIAEVASNAQRAVSLIAGEIRQAENIYFPTSSTTQISLLTRNGIPVGEDFTYVDFYLCGTMICEKREGEDPFPITSADVAVTDFSFNYISTSTAPSVRISLTMDYADYSSRAGYDTNYSILTTASLRSN